MFSRQRTSLLAAACAAGAVLGTPAQADYPERNITLIVPSGSSA